MVKDDLDTDGYPTEEALNKIADWPPNDPKGWFEFIHSLWAYHEFGWKELEETNELEQPVHRYSISTCGWSGNEEIIEAMEANGLLWAFHWVQSRRGGHYIFEINQKDEDENNKTTN